MQLDFEDIKKLLPHRFPCIMIDRVLEVEHGKRAVAIKNVSGNEIYFPGHFPEKAIMPGALMIEAMAQTAIILYSIGKKEKENKRKTVIYLGSVKARFMRPVVPGDQLKIVVRVEKTMADSAYVTAELFVDSTKVSESELIFYEKPL